MNRFIMVFCDNFSSVQSEFDVQRIELDILRAGCLHKINVTVIVIPRELQQYAVILNTVLYKVVLSHHINKWGQ